MHEQSDAQTSIALLDYWRVQYHPMEASKTTGREGERTAMQASYLTLNEQGLPQQLAQAHRDQPSIYIQNSSSDANPVINRYIHTCREQGLPIIYILYSGKYAKVELDLIYVPHTDELLSSTFVDQMMTACELACGGYNSLCYPDVITAVRAPRENALTLALSFLAIYQRMQGKQVPFPVFEHPAQPGPVRVGLQLAKQQGYARAKGVADPLPLRYQYWCSSVQVPYIHLWTRRADLAEIGATFIQPLSPQQVETLTRFAEELNFATQRTRSNKNVRHWVYIDPLSVNNIGSWLPGAAATLFVEQIVALCRRAGMFASAIE